MKQKIRITVRVPNFNARVVMLRMFIGVPVLQSLYPGLFINFSTKTHDVGHPSRRAGLKIAQQFSAGFEKSKSMPVTIAARELHQ